MHGPFGFPRKATGGRAPSFSIDSGRSALERSLQMLSSVCGDGYGPERCPDAGTLGFPSGLRLGHLTPRPGGP